MAEADRGGGHAVLHIHPSRNSYPYVLDHASRVNQVENVMSDLVRLGVGRMVISRRVVVAVAKDPGLGVVRGDVQTIFHNQCAAHLRRELFEGFLIFLKGAVDVQMVSVHGCDRGDRRVQLEEGAVKLVSLRHDGRRVACQKVGVVILGDSSKKSRAAFAAFREDVRHEGACCGLPVRSRHSQASLTLGQLTEHPGSLDQSVAVLPHIDKFLKVSRNGRGIDDKCRCHVLWNIIGVILVVDVNPFLLKRVGQVRWCPVVARDRIAFELVVPCDGAHADATDSYEINL